MSVSTDQTGPIVAPKRGFRGIIGAILVSLALWAFLVVAALGLILKIMG
jgi:hypothetical protein